MDKYHTPLFAAEIVALLQAHNCKIVVDGTCGEGGHTLAFLKAGMQVIPMDYDTRLIERAQSRLNKEGFGETSGKICKKIVSAQNELNEQNQLNELNETLR